MYANLDNALILNYLGLQVEFKVYILSEYTPLSIKGIFWINIVNYLNMMSKGKSIFDISSTFDVL